MKTTYDNKHGHIFNYLIIPKDQQKGNAGYNFSNLGILVEV